ncbi:hypothetical protein FACS1894120_2770 [Clostridia bacterium]|nr:hypothetical protein FACS1894120_2770 [Clostridia bacterium]
MSVVFVIGKKNEGDTLSNLIIDNLPSSYDLTYVDMQSGIDVTQRGSGYPVTVIDTPVPPSGFTRESIVVVRHGGSLPLNKLSGKNVYIASSDDAAPLSALAGTAENVITVGSSEKDTVTYTGLRDAEMCVSLTRELRAFSGRVIEPLEFPVPVTGKDVYGSLAFSALRIILDDSDWEAGKIS